MTTRVCLDLTPNEMHDRHGGIGRYTTYLLPELARLMADEGGWELSALLSSSSSPVPVDEALRRIESFPPPISVRRHRWQRRLAVGPLLQAAKIDLFHITQPVAFPAYARCKLVTTAYDEIPLVHPEHPPQTPMQAAVQLAKRGREWWHCSRADRVIAISACTREDLVRGVGVDASRISVVHLGVDLNRFRSESDPDEASQVRRTYNLPEKYFVCVGSDHYRKNHRRLFDAWLQVASKIPEDLVIVGKALYASTLDELTAEVARRGLSDRFRWLSGISDDQLPAIYRQSTAAIAPSLYEGFGLTILEAMACGAPVAAARNGAYDEVGGDAALYFDPQSVDGIAASMEQLSRDAGLRQRLHEAGLARARAATWRRVAEETLAVYRQVLGVSQ